MKKFKSYILVAMMGLSVTSCKDFLTLMPLNEVVLENFYTNEGDVESVLRGAYGALEASDCIVRMSAWGEMRSDNIVPGNEDSSSSDDDLTQFISENINSQNSLTTYLCFYKAINYASTVLHYAPEVHQKDPNYHGSEMKAHEAEAIAIRSLCYWYLIRAFGDVPYTTRPSIDDTYDFFIGKTPFNDVLDSLINDVARVKDYAMVHYSSDLSKLANTARFSRAAVYAMLADMYLWKGNWEECIKCCEYITKLKVEDYKTIKEEKGLDCTIELMFDKYPLITETFSGDKCGNAYNEIFGAGNSFESLFELPFTRDFSDGFVSKYYNSSNSSTGNLKASSKISRDKSSNDPLFTELDARYYQNISPDKSYGIVKYVYEKMDYNMKLGTQDKTGDRRQNNANDASWIVYRYTDVLLMEAEAKTMLARDINNADSVTLLLQEAFELVDAVNRRGICQSRYGSPTLSFNDYNTVSKMEKLVFDERRRELMFEGKRWFDLVRQALREGSAEKVLDAVKDRPLSTNTSAVAAKFSSLNGLFLPYNKDEIKINDNLKQNPAYADTERSKKAK